MKIKRADIYTISILSLFTLIYIIGTLQLGSPFKGNEPTMSLFPWITIVTMIIGIIGYYFGSKKEYSKADEINNYSYSSIARPLLGILVFSLFILLFFFVGYWIASIFICFFTAIVFEYDSSNVSKSIIIASIVSMLIPIIGYLFYQKLFHIRLPEGIIW